MFNEGHTRDPGRPGALAQGRVGPRVRGVRDLRQLKLVEEGRELL